MRNVLVLLFVLLSVAACTAACSSEIATDTGIRGGEVALSALPDKGPENAILKRFEVGSLDKVRSAEIGLFAALRDPTDANDFSFARWEWVFFDLNGHGWVARVEDLPLYRRSLFAVQWEDVKWESIPIPEVSYLRQGINELIVWNNNPPEKSRDRFLIVATDNTGSSKHSFVLKDGKWEGKPGGELMVRLKLNELSLEEQKQRDSIGLERFRKAREEGRELVWGFTDAVHKIFADEPYTGPLGNAWRMDAARGEYESCQLVIAPVSKDLRLMQVSVGDFTSEDGAIVPKESLVVRQVVTAKALNRQWPDALPEAFPTDISRGRVQAYWLTIHVPETAKPGVYKAQVTASAMNTGGRDGTPVTFALELRVRNFSLPKASRFQMVAPAPETPIFAQYQVANCQYLGPYPRPQVSLDRKGRINVDFGRFDRQVQRRLDSGQDQFSLGLSYTGAGSFTPECFNFDWPVTGTNDIKRVNICPINQDGSQNPEGKALFEQYLSTIYRHLETEGWTKHFWKNPADEPIDQKWTTPLTNYFALIKQIAPKLRIMVTYGPTDRFGPNVDIATIMMNHLEPKTASGSQRLHQTLWCYSCGDLNNPALTIPHSAISLRLWHWLQEKWGVERALLWHTTVYGENLDHPGLGDQGAGDGQLFYRNTARPDNWFPSIRAEMLRDGIEDREYIALLRTLIARAPANVPSKTLAKARALATVPDDIIKTQWEMTRDVDKLLVRRAEIADMIEALVEFR